MSDTPTSLYSVVDEPRGDSYRALLRFLKLTCDAVILVVRAAERMSPAAREVVNRLDRSLTGAAERGQWPGTALLGHTARVYTYAFDNHCLEVIRSSVDGLYDWVGPERPEDLCILRGDAPCLTSISHERTAYLDLTPSEVEQLSTANSRLTLHRGELVPASGEPYRLFGAFLDDDSLADGESVDRALQKYVGMSSREQIAEVVSAIRGALFSLKRGALFSLKDDVLLRAVLERWGAAPGLYARERPSALLRKTADQLERGL
jgi:hypothetical protein